MKRHGNLFEKIITLENIELAHIKAKKDKSFYDEVIEVDKNPDFYFKKIREMLINKTYTIKPEDYTMFTKLDKGKLREIYKLDYFPHRIIQHCVLNVTEGIFLSTLISNTFSSIPERGIHLALEKMGNDIVRFPDETDYCLKMDIKKFYPNINQQICSNMFRKKFKDKDLLWLLDVFIYSMDGEKGLAIGSLFSQWGGNFYLTYFDHWLKEIKGVEFYYRYCDDLVILHHNKKFLHTLKREIDGYLSINLDLEIKGNWQVFPTRVRGVDFVGYRHFGDYILLRKTTSKNMIRKMKRVLQKCESGKEMSYTEWCSVNSYKGWIIWCNGHNLYQKYIKPLESYCEDYYKRNIAKKERRNNLTNKETLKRFSEIADTEDIMLQGDKVKIEDILDKEILIKDCWIGKSKFKDGEMLKLQFELDGKNHIVFTGSSVLIDQTNKYKDKLPFLAEINKIDKFYTFA